MNPPLIDIYIFCSSDYYMWAYVFFSFGEIPRTRITWLYKFMYNFLKNYQTVFQNGCTISHSHEWYRSVPVSLYPSLPNLIWSVLLMIAMWVDMKWYLRVVLICVSRIMILSTFFHVPVSHLHVLLHESIIHSFCILFVFLFLSCKASLYILVASSLEF